MSSSAHLLDVALPPGRSTLLGALRACLAAAGDTRDVAEVAGLSGLAFHLNVDPLVSLAGVAGFPWRQELPAMAARLGYDLDLIYCDDEDPRFARAQSLAVSQLIDAAWRGQPSILWGVQLPEFGVVRGFDAGRRELCVSGVLDGCGGAATLAYERLGRGAVPVLLCATLGCRVPAEEDEATLAALRHAWRHAAGGGPRLGGFTCGLDALAAWRGALDAGRVDPAGHAYTLMVTAELRAAAGPFLRRAAERLGGDAAAHLEAAAAGYARAADRLIALSADTPFPLPDGWSLTTTLRERAAAIGAVRAAEADAVAALGRALAAADRRRAAAGVTVAEATAADAALLFRCIADLPLGGLDAEAAAERARVGGRLGGPLRALLARSAAGEVVGHLYYAALPDAGAPLEVDDDGRYLYLFCPWVAGERRASGIGTALIEALVRDAADAGWRGIFTEATAQDVFLHVDALAALGFAAVERDDDGGALMYRAVAGPAPAARRAPPAAPPAGPLPVVVAQQRPCPLLARARQNVIDAAGGAAERGARLGLEVRAAPPSEIAVGGRRLPLGYLPREAAETALIEAADLWERAGRRGSG